MTSKNFIPGNILRIAGFVLLLAAPVIASAQTEREAEAAYGSPYGIFVLTGSDIIVPERASDKTSGYLIERKGERESQWHNVALVTAPGRMKDFETSLQYWCAKFPEWADYARIPVEKLFTVIERTGTTDSLMYYGQLLPVRLAAGTVWLDSTVNDTLKYQYRVSKASAGESAKLLFTSVPARREKTTFLGRPVISRKVVSGNEVIMTCGLDPGYRPAFYRVFRKKEGEKSFSGINPSMVRFIRSDTSFVTVRDTAVIPGRVYSWYITPVDYFGRVSVNSEIVRTGIYSFSSVRAPYNLATTARMPAGGIEVRWKLDDPSALRSLNIYRSVDYDTGYVLIKKISPSDTLFTDAAVEPMRKYFYYFVMEGFFDELSSPGVRFFGIAENKIPPIRPVIASSEGIADGARLEVKVFNPDVRAVRIYRRIQGAREFSPVAVAPVTEDNSVVYTDTSKYFGGYTLLSYAAVAENTSYALSEFSDTVSVYPASETVTASPDNLVAAYENGAVNMIWDNIRNTHPEIIGYRVYRRVRDTNTARQKEYSLLADGFLQPEVNYYTDDQVVPGNTYEYIVRGVDFKNGESKAGASALITVTKPRPVPPSGMTLTVGSEAVSVGWEAPEQREIVSFRLYRYERGKAPVVIATVPQGTILFNDTTAQKGKLYFYYLTSVHENGIESSIGKEEGIWR